MLNINATEKLKIVKVHGTNGIFKMNKSDIFTVLLIDSNVTEKIKCKHKCIVNFMCSEGEIKQKNDLLCVLSPCPHNIVISGMCGLCSMPVEIKNLGNGEIQCPTSTRFAMIHSNKDVVVKKEAAIEISLKDDFNLLKKRKLSLLVDLDATILHSTDKNFANDMKDVYHYTMRAEQNSSVLLNYHTKFRPFLKQFLTEMSALYEMHIYTFGNKSYAEKIAEIIDPDKRFFGQRIISKDDSFDPMKKSANLKSLFPRGDNMVCIIDDRTDVWNNAPNCIHVQPYMFFPETGDINDPYKPRDVPTVSSNSLSKSTASNGLKTVKNEEIPAIVKNNNEQVESIECSESNAVEEKEISDSKLLSENDKSVDDSAMLDGTPDEVQKGSDAVDVNLSESADVSTDPNTESVGKVTTEDDRTSEPIRSALEIVDRDQYLLSLANILREIHRRFYEKIDQLQLEQSMQGIVTNNKLPDIKALMTEMRAGILKGCRVNLSGLIPLNHKVKDSYEYRMLTSMGAEYLHDVSLPSMRSMKSVVSTKEPFTTHLICKSEGTKKMKQVTHYIADINRLLTNKPDKLARSIHKVHLVKHDWLWQSYFFWQRVNEHDFCFRPSIEQLPIPDGFHALVYEGAVPKTTQSQTTTVTSTTGSRKRVTTSPPKSFSAIDSKKSRIDSGKGPVVSFAISEADLKELDDIEDESNSGISTDSFDDSVNGSYDDKDVPLDNVILHYSLQEQLEMFNEVDEAMDEEKCEKLRSPESSDYYNSDSSSSSHHSDDSEDFAKPPKNWEKLKESDETNSNGEQEMDYGDFENGCAAFGLYKEAEKSDIDDFLEDLDDF